MSEELDYVRSRSITARLLEKFPQLGFIRRGDPTLDHVVALIMLGYDEAEIDGELVLASDRKVYISALAPLDRSSILNLTPATTDLLLINGTPYEIVDVKPPDCPSGTVVFWEICARL